MTTTITRVVAVDSLKNGDAAGILKAELKQLQADFLALVSNLEDGGTVEIHITGLPAAIEKMAEPKPKKKAVKKKA